MVFDQFRLDGKVALVTGAGRGLGQTMALTLAQAGATVVAVARTEGEIHDTVDRIKRLRKTGLAIPLNVTDSRAVDRVIEQVASDLGSIDILINNAGGELGYIKAAIDLSDEEWSQILNTNLTGAFYCTRAVGRHMLSRGWGRVINVTCIYGTRGSVNHLAYASAKGALLQFSQALALEWAQNGVTVNALGLGWFEPQRDLASAPQRTAQLERVIPTRRLGIASDLKLALIYLSSEASRYFTGQSIWIDGGILCR
jgi:NAD(P)-dependent dehydrogenase (short-subunit alcohol dehydrogenase family)